MSASIPKTYSFGEPVPPPSVHEIYSTSEFVDESVISASEKDEEEEVVGEKKPRWLARGDLSDITSVEDMLNLSEMTKESILLNLRIRYNANLIYTYIGSILISVNPYRQLPIYTTKLVNQYNGNVLGPSLPPHLYAIGNEAFSHLIQDFEDQCIIVSGETGSGKTETVRILLQYLAQVDASNHSTITEQLLQATPLLESFGNAKTIRNHNSSRFGKYLEVVYDSGRVLGGRVSQYLLEKSRIVHQHYGERNFHIFYELLSGISAEQKSKLRLREPHHYEYLNCAYNWEIEERSDTDGYKRCMKSLDILRFTELEKSSMFEILASVLHIGNISYREGHQQGKDTIAAENPELLEIICSGLQISANKLSPLLMTKIMVIKGEKVSVPLSLAQALDTRDALAKALYSQLFTWLVHRVNKTINPTLHQHKSIALLDIFGFENFRENSFEQLCINYANEQLQHLFNKTVFESEQEFYEQQEIEWESLEFNSNEETVDLFSLKPSGILCVLDDESQFPKGTDRSFLEKLHHAHTDNELYIKPKTEKLEFGVKHYAGEITYSVSRFVAKNKDMLRPDVVDLLCSSKNQIVSQVFGDHKEANSVRHLNKVTGRITTLKPRTPTVAASFQQSLLNLLEKINRCKLWFVRCFKPNTSKSPLLFNMSIIEDQISSAGLLETIRIRSLGYPHHMTFEYFLERYEYLYRCEPDDDSEAKDFCVKVLEKEFEAAKCEDFQAGSSKLFLKEPFYQHVEQQRLEVVLKAVRIIENKVKTSLLNRRFRRQSAAAVKIQAFWRAYFHKTAYRRFLKSLCRCQANLKCRWQRRYFLEQKHRLAAERDRRWVEADLRRVNSLSSMLSGIALHEVSTGPHETFQDIECLV